MGRLYKFIKRQESSFNIKESRLKSLRKRKDFNFTRKLSLKKKKKNWPIRNGRRKGGGGINCGN